MPKSNIFIISGPSGAGEDSIISGLEKIFPMERVITTTSRPMRPGEAQGNPYHFIAPEEFRQRITKNEFIEYAQHYNDNYYGAESKELERVASASRRTGKIGIWKIDYKGVMTAKKKYPEIIAIFVNAPSLEILENRIRRRDKVSEEYIKERMDYTREWLKHTDLYDYTVINKEGKLAEAINEVVEIIKKHS